MAIFSIKPDNYKVQIRKCNEKKKYTVLPLRQRALQVLSHTGEPQKQHSWVAVRHRAWELYSSTWPKPQNDSSEKHTGEKSHILPCWPIPEFNTCGWGPCARPFFRWRWRWRRWLRDPDGLHLCFTDFSGYHIPLRLLCCCSYFTNSSLWIELSGGWTPSSLDLAVCPRESTIHPESMLSKS